MENNEQLPETRDELDAEIDLLKGDGKSIRLMTLVAYAERTGLYAPYKSVAEWLEHRHNKIGKRYGQLVRKGVNVNAVIREVEVEAHHGAPVPEFVVPSERLIRPLGTLLAHPDSLKNVWREARAKCGDTIKPDVLAQLVFDERRRLENAKPIDAVDDVRINDYVRTADVTKEGALDFLNGTKINLVITSIPYGVGLIYDVYDDRYHARADFLATIRQAFANIVPHVHPHGGRVCVVCPAVVHASKREKKSGIRVHHMGAELIGIMHDLGLSFRDEIVWRKQEINDTNRDRYGSYLSCSGPNCRIATERVYVFSRGGHTRRAHEEKRDGYTETQWLAMACDHWEINTAETSAKARKGEHPCAYPVELPSRLMQLFGERSDVILDPYGGSGTTAIAAVRLGRTCYSVDISKRYTHKARAAVLAEIEGHKGTANA